MSEKEELQKELEALKKKNKEREEMARLREQIQMERRIGRKHTIASGFGGKMLKGLQNIGKGVMKAGENINQGDVGSSMGLGKKRKE